MPADPPGDLHGPECWKSHRESGSYGANLEQSERVMPDISVEEKVRAFIENRFLASAGLDRVQEEESLVENGIIDSTGVLELVHFLEETFAIKIEDDELVPDNLDSIRNVVAFLERKTSANPLRVRG